MRSGSRAAAASKKRCQAHPAWQRTLELYAERLGESVEDLR
jgi:hypothetical protein